MESNREVVLELQNSEENGNSDSNKSVVDDNNNKIIVNNIDDMKMKLLLSFIPNYNPNSKNERKNIKLQEIIKNLNELKKIITN